MQKNKRRIIFDIITIYPDCVESYLNCAILKKALGLGIIKINIHNLRDYASDKHRSVDDSPYGGGPGMLMKIEPVFKCLKKILKKKNSKTKVIVFTPRGKIYNQKMARDFSKLERIIMICGRFEGIDERVVKYLADMNVSIGNYVLAGGEIPALALVESVSRLLPGVLGEQNSLNEESFTLGDDDLEYPQYTRPEKFVMEKGGKSLNVPKVLLSGDHAKIKEYRLKQAKKR